MLGFQIALTGLISAVVGLFTVLFIGEWPGWVKGLLPLLALFGGLAALIVGLLMAIWA